MTSAMHLSVMQSWLVLRQPQGIVCMKPKVSAELHASAGCFAECEPLLTPGPQQCTIAAACAIAQQAWHLGRRVCGDARCA